MKLKVTDKRKFGKFTNRWKLNNTLNQWIKKQSQSKLENKNTAYYNLWNKVNAMLRKEFIAINTNIKGEKRYQINNPNFHLNEL